MTTHDADPGDPSGLEDSLPGLGQAAEPGLDAYGVPVQNRAAAGRIHVLGLAGVICGIVPMVLAAHTEHHKLAGYLVALGILSAFLAMTLPIVVPMKTGWDKPTRGQWIGIAGSLLGLIGFAILMAAIGHPLSD